MKETILKKIPAECSWRNTLLWYDAIPSTNTLARCLAKEGAAHGTVLVAGQQTGGRGRMGRSFQSPAGEGVYLSLILRPNCPPAQLMHLTCAVGVAMVRAIQQAANITPDIKWINDLVWQKKKLGGILTELSLNPQTGSVDFAVIGIGINCLQAAEGFSPEIADIATSLSIACGHPVEPATLAAAMVTALWELDTILLSDKTTLMEIYRRHCITLGKEIWVIRDTEKLPGRALDVDSDGGLLVEFADGHQQIVNSGEVSIRSFSGYT